MAALALKSKYGVYFKKSLFQMQPQNQAYLELILSFVAVAFFGWFALRPTINTIIDLLNEIEVKQETVHKLDQKIDALVAADTTYKSATSKLDLLDQAFPTEHQVAQFTSQLDSLVQESQVQLGQYNYQSFPLDKDYQTKVAAKKLTAKDSVKETASPWLSLEFELSAQGGYQQLRQLIANLYQLRRIILTQTINFQQETRRLDQQLQLKLGAQVIYL